MGSPSLYNHLSKQTLRQRIQTALSKKYLQPMLTQLTKTGVAVTCILWISMTIVKIKMQNTTITLVSLSIVQYLSQSITENWTMDKQHINFILIIQLNDLWILDGHTLLWLLILRGVTISVTASKLNLPPNSAEQSSHQQICRVTVNRKYTLMQNLEFSTWFIYCVKYIHW